MILVAYILCFCTKLIKFEIVFLVKKKMFLFNSASYYESLHLCPIIAAITGTLYNGLSFVVSAYRHNAIGLHAW